MCPRFFAAKEKLRTVIILKKVRDNLIEYAVYKKVHLIKKHVRIE